MILSNMMPTSIRGKLNKALGHLTSEHATYEKRVKELSNLLTDDPSQGLKEIFDFIENILVPHFESEETLVFPVILKLKPDKKPLIDELLREHEIFLRFHSLLKNNIAVEDTSKTNLEATKVLLELQDHIKKESPLQDLVLEVL